MLDDVFLHGGDVVVAPLQLAGAAADVVDADQERLVLSSSSLSAPQRTKLQEQQATHTVRVLLSRAKKANYADVTTAGLACLDPKLYI